MVIVARPERMAWLRRIRFWALALLGVVVGHEAVYLALYGAQYETAMASTGHGYWLSFALLALVVAGIPLGVGIFGLMRLRAALRIVARGAAPPSEPTDSDVGPSYLGEFTGLLPRLFVVIVLAFTIQENVESVAIGHGLPGLWVLGAGVVLPVLFAISLLMACAGAWLRWREAVLERRLAAAQALTGRARRYRGTRAAAHWRDVAACVAHSWLIARRLAGRAPPVSITA